MDANMSKEDPTDDKCTSVELELYFLIAKFLSSGPCKKAAEVLQGELEEHKLLPKRVDWEGAKHPRSFDSLSESLPHISASHLVQICQRIGPILDREIPPSVKGVVSLLGAGRQSLLRTQQAAEKTVWKGSTFAVCRHGRPLRPPHNMTVSPNMWHLVNGHQISGRLNMFQVKSTNLYSKVTQLTRALGHLSAVYCVAFDRTGQFIITGADDHLIKIWSATSGRLLSTLRGHAAEITDMAVNYENTMLATGSCDKQIRVWCLRTISPIAVLQAHTGLITSLQFSPMVRKDTRYLMSTGGDGCVCFWQWNVTTQKFNPKPIKFIERSRAGAQMLCSSFSPGGIFLATGSADQVIRVYCFSGVFPEKICELEAHTDQVDSIQYANHCDKFVSGSKDGSARLWRYERQTWKAILLNMGQQLPSGGSQNGSVDDKKNYAVTMIEWTIDDMFIITAVNDNSLKVWDANSGQLVNILKGHQGEVFVLENNPVDSRIMLSAGHDGHIIMWDLTRGTQIFKNFNTISGQGHGAVFDCKWAPDGLSFATTDSHGFVRLFGLGSNEKYKILPEEYFFHTDYRPLIRDQHGYVLDEQTQQAPHLMPAPFLVDIDGNPHPPHLQRLVPGRQNCSDNQLIPQIGISPSGDREVLDNSIAEAQINNNEQLQQQPPGANAGDEVEPEAQPAPEPVPGPSSPAGPDRQQQDLDSLIARMQRDMDMRLARGDAESPPFSPPPRGADQQAEGAVRVISVVQQAPRRRSGEGASSANANSKQTRSRSVVTPLEPAAIRKGEERRLAMADMEIKYYQSERKKRPPVFRQDSSDSSSLGDHRHTRRQQQQRRRPAGRRARQSRNEETGRNRLTTRALYDTDVEDDEMGEEEPRRQRDESAEEEEAEDENSEHEDEERAAVDSDDHMWNSDKSDTDSSDYSDWTPIGTRNMAPPKRRSQRQVKRRRFASFTDDDDDDEEEEEEEAEESDSETEIDENHKEQEKETEGEGDDAKDEDDEEESETADKSKEEKPKKKVLPKRQPRRKKRAPPRKKLERKRKIIRRRPRARQGVGNRINTGEVPDEYKPPDWLTETVPHKAPYYPQIGDEILYFRQGHETYVNICKLRKAYDINPKKNQPWHKAQLKEQELVKVVGIKYEIKPPRLVCLKLAVIDSVTSKPTGASFSVKYHDMPDVIDFLVLRQTFNTAVQRKWKPGDRFRSIIDKAWWCGTISTQEPLDANYPDSLFQCYNVKWDNGEIERMSPWDFEPLLGENEPDEVGASVPLRLDEIKEVLYCPQDGEWPDHGMGTECERLIRGFEQVMELSVAEDFVAPVDLNAFPSYAMDIEYPIDLSTIKTRLENRFYRRTAAVMYDVRLLEGNAKKFNLPESRISKSATLVTELLLRYIRDTDALDVMPMYTELAKDSDYAVAHGAEDEDDDGPGPSSGRTRTRNASGPGRRRLNSGWDLNSWKEECENLLQSMFDLEDSEPFKEPVDLEEYQDYLTIVDTPMDLTTVQSKLEGDMYSTPVEFAEDVRLIFTNSKTYNNNKRSKIYIMALRLSAMFEDKMKNVLILWKKAKKIRKVCSKCQEEE